MILDSVVGGGLVPDNWGQRAEQKQIDTIESIEWELLLLPTLKRRLGTYVHAINSIWSYVTGWSWHKQKKAEAVAAAYVII